VFFGDEWGPSKDGPPCTPCSYSIRQGAPTKLADKHRNHIQKDTGNNMLPPNRGKKMIYDEKEYIPFSKKMMKDLGIKDYAVLMDIIDRDDLDGNRGMVEIKYGAISHDLGTKGFSKDYLISCVKRLRKKGFIETWRGGNHKGHAKQFYNVKYDNIKEHINKLKNKGD
jgi:hypothetical protein